MSHCPDVEDIAVLAEGKLNGKPGTQLIEHVSGCESCYQIYVQTLRTLEAISKRKRKRGFWFSVPPLALAASLAIFLKATLFPVHSDPLSITMMNRFASIVEPTRLHVPFVGHRGVDALSPNDLSCVFQTGLSMGRLVILFEASSINNALSILRTLKTEFKKDNNIQARISKMEATLNQPDMIHVWEDAFISLSGVIEGRFEKGDLSVYRLGEWAALSRAILLSKSSEAIEQHFNEKNELEMITALSNDDRIPGDARDALHRIAAICSNSDPIQNNWFELKSDVEAVIRAMSRDRSG